MVLAIGCLNTKGVFLNERILPCSKQKNKHEQEKGKMMNKADPVFIKLLLLLDNAGVPIECLRCRVDAEGMKPEQLIPVKLLNSSTAG